MLGQQGQGQQCQPNQQAYQEGWLCGGFFVSGVRVEGAGVSWTQCDGHTSGQHSQQ